MSTMKEWSRETVAEAHGYTRDKLDSKQHHHQIFSEWLRSNQPVKSVFDVGCCSGIVLNSIGNQVDFYYGVDLCDKNIQVAREHFGVNHNFTFDVLDVENSMQQIDVSKFDVCYVDSVISMLEDPRQVLLWACSNFDHVFLGRTACSVAETVKSEYSWGGMQSTSTLWKFSDSFFSEIADQLGDVSVFIDRENFTVIFKRVKK